MGKVLFIACTNVARAMVEEIQNNRDIQSEVVGIVNLNTERSIGKANFDSYADLAVKYGIPIHYCKNVNDEVTLNFIKEKSPDIIIQSGWSQKFKDELLSMGRYGCIGEHPAPLPRGRGAACVNWAILTGETSWGDTFFKMVAEYDKGEVYAQEFFTIEDFDTVATVYEKVALTSKTIVRKYIDRWCQGDFDTIEQDESKVTYFQKRTPADGEIKSFDTKAKQLHDFIRAQTFPYPGAFVQYNGEKLLILLSRLCVGKNSSEAPSTIIATGKDGGIYIACGEGEVIEIVRVKPENEPSMWASDWLKALNTENIKLI